MRAHTYCQTSEAFLVVRAALEVVAWSVAMRVGDVGALWMWLLPKVECGACLVKATATQRSAQLFLPSEPHSKSNISCFNNPTNLTKRYPSRTWNSFDCTKADCTHSQQLLWRVSRLGSRLRDHVPQKGQDNKARREPARPQVLDIFPSNRSHHLATCIDTDIGHP